MNDGFGAALAEFMRQNHLTQQEVAVRTGIAQPVIGRLLKMAQPELPTINKIAKGLGVHIQISETGKITIDPLKIPIEIEWQAFTSGIDPYEIFFSLHDKCQGKHMFDAKLFYRPGEREPYKVSYERQDWVPGYVSDFGLLRWAKSYAVGLLPFAHELAENEQNPAS